MFFKKKYSCLSDEVVNKKNLIYKNREQAYNYYEIVPTAVEIEVAVPSPDMA